MAKVSPGSMIADASGSIGTTTYQRTRAGLIIRSRVTPANPGTSRQVATRNAIAYLTNRWAATLTAGQRLRWITLANANPERNRLGTSYTRTGLQMYIRHNMALRLGSHALIDNAPATLAVASFTSIAVILHISTNNCYLYGGMADAPTYSTVVALATAPLSAGRSAPNNTWKRLSERSGGSSFTANYWTDYVAAWGTPTAGKKTWFRLYPYSYVTGTPGTEVRVGGTWVA